MEGIPAYSLADWDVALRNPGGASASETVTLATFEQSVHLTSYRWFQALAADVSDTIARVRVFDNLLDEKAGKLAPGLIRFRSEATSIEQLVETMLAASQVDVPEVEAALVSPALDAVADQQRSLPASVSSATPSPPPNGSHALAQQVGSRIQSRAEAYRLLEEVAEYLHENDPHSPTPYLIRRAVSWGAMHFDELIPELVRDSGELSDILKLLRLDQPIQEKE
jgi:type VI secretion system ImpA family protein